MQNDEIANAFDEIGDLLEIQNANAFRVRAYRNAARTLRDLAEPVADLADDPDALDELPAIGKDLAEKIRTLVTTGTLPQLEELREEVPPETLLRAEDPDRNDVPLFPVDDDDDGDDENGSPASRRFRGVAKPFASLACCQFEKRPAGASWEFRSPPCRSDTDR